MPEISRFYGIIIRMFYNDHNPPHFHIIYQEFEAVMSIVTLEVLDGEIPKRAMSLTLEWANQNRDQLLLNWERARNQEELNKIKPLE